jgi:4-amino-4-deoxy-L-arabinose transferase-like glycosyltransferase
MSMDARADSMSFRIVAAGAAVVAAAVLLRALFPSADPPWNPSVGIVWHDEGAWVHNARNRALYGSWFAERDAWNPLFIAPVFTGLEYLSFAAFGVGVRQARLVSEVGGFLSVVLLALGVRRMAGTAAGLTAGALLATNYVYVMYNRAALMETTMVVFMVAAWYFYVRAQERPAWGLLAGACALLAFFTKAAAAFFLIAIGLDAVLSLLARARGEQVALERRAGLATLGGLAASSLVALAAFVVPNWESYRFYNWQMSVTRKPVYGLEALKDRLSWFPILHDLFTRMWLVTIVAMAGMVTALARWRQVRPPERLLILWVALGAIELIIHDVGNERRFIFFIPAVVALAATVVAGRREGAPPDLAGVPLSRAILAAPIVWFALYVAAGGIARVFFLYEIRPGVRIAAACAAAGAVILYATWPRIPAWLVRQRWSARAAFAIVLLVCAGDLIQYAQWAAGRTYKNYEASLAVGRALPPGTSVHGKLANGLSLENHIRPVFVGREFGNYADRKTRDDVRYILTYVEPRVGYEGAVIKDVLDAYPQRRIIMTFEVAETTGGHDRAALIDKFAGAVGRQDRAHD